MAVQDAQAPGGQDEKAGPGEEDAHEADGEVPLGPGKSRGDDVNEVRGGKDSDKDETRDDQGERQDIAEASLFASSRDSGSRSFT